MQLISLVLDTFVLVACSYLAKGYGMGWFGKGTVMSGFPSS